MGLIPSVFVDSFDVKNLSVRRCDFKGLQRVSTDVFADDGSIEFGEVEGAPLAGDEAAWAPRLNKGMDTLVNIVVNGSGGMPPLGLCMDCSAEQFAALTQFMATGE